MHAVPSGLIGPRAKNILEREKRGSVLSSHATGLYCRFENGDIILLHDARYGVIPFGLGYAVCPPGGWKVFPPGTTVLNDALRQSLTLGEERYAYADAVSPTSLLSGLPPTLITTERLHTGVETSIPLLGQEGIAARYMVERSALLNATPPSAPFADMWENALWEPLQALLAYCMADEPHVTPDKAVSPLIGLGPGLTPLGDDILCGLLYSAHALYPLFPPSTALSRILDRLAPAIANLAPGATTSQSVAFLAGAANGGLFGMLDATLTSLFTHNVAEVRNAFAATLEVGHTSGSGLLLGLLLAAELNTFSLP